MANKYEMFSVCVTEVEHATPLIKRFTLAREDGAAMPAFSGGSHVIVQMQGADGSQFSNAYSLMSDPRDTRSVLSFCLDTCAEAARTTPRPLPFGVARM